MAFDKNKNNPFYTPRKESLLKEVGITIDVIVVCLVLVGAILRNFNKYAIEQRQNESYVAEVEDYYSDTYEDVYDYEADYEYEESYDEEYIEYVPEDLMNPAEDFTQDDSINNSYDDAVQEDLHYREPEPTYEESYYIIPDSDVRYLSSADLAGLTAEELRIARNEIYARHGRMFNDAGLQAYFDSQPWYYGSILPENFSQSMLTNVEVVNAEFIASYEANMGY